jgi:hypothetical protein
MGNRITQSGVSVTVQQGGTMVGGTPQDLGLLSAMAEGLFLVCDVPPGTTTIGASFDGMTFLSHDVNVTAATLVETEVRPGY